MPKRSGTPRTEVDAVGLLVEDQVDRRPGRQQPDAVDRRRRGRGPTGCRATERALPWPLARADVRRGATPACWPRPRRRPGPVKVLTTGAVRVQRREVERQRRGRHDRRDPRPVRFRGADLEVGARAARRSPRRRTSLTVLPLTRRMTSPTRCPKFEGVVARGGARLPPRRLRRQPAPSASPSRRGPRRRPAASSPDTPDVCDSRCRTSTSSLPFAANSGQYRATGA